MFDEFPRYDMKSYPKRPKLRLLTYVLTKPALWKHRTKIQKIHVKGIKPPYILLANHNAYQDVNVLLQATFPHPITYVIAIDGFIGREKILRAIGGICKRKFTQDTFLLKQIKYILDKKWIVSIFPEARYSLCGTNAIIPKSVAKMCYYYKVPVLMLKMHGHHINSPFWNLTDRKVKGCEAELYPLISKEEVGTLDVEEIDRRIQHAFIYDEYTWQKKKGIEIKYEGRAEGLHKVLYKCPHCGTEYEMDSKGIHLFCDHCHKKWEYTTLGELKALEGETEYSHIPDWYEWERSEVRKEIEAGKYYYEGECHVDILPNADKFIPVGNGKLIHDMNGFKLTGNYKGQDYEVEIPAKRIYGVHIEYEYLGKYGDCVDLNTLDNTYYVYPHGKNFAVTKFSLATEELFKYYQEQKEKDL